MWELEGCEEVEIKSGSGVSLERFNKFLNLVLGNVQNMTKIESSKFREATAICWPVLTGVKREIRIQNPSIERETIHTVCRLFKLQSQTVKLTEETNNPPVKSYGRQCGECGNTPGCCCRCPEQPQYIFRSAGAMMVLSVEPIKKAHHAKKSTKANVVKLPFVNRLNKKFMRAAIEGRFEKMPELIHAAELAGLTSTICNEVPYKTMVLSWKGICTLYFLQEQWAVLGVPRQVFAVIIGYVFA